MVPKHLRLLKRLGDLMKKVMFKQRTEEGNELTKVEVCIVGRKVWEQDKESIFKKEKHEDDKV